MTTLYEWFWALGGLRFEIQTYNHGQPSWPPAWYLGDDSGRIRDAVKYPSINIHFNDPIHTIRPLPYLEETTSSDVANPDQPIDAVSSSTLFIGHGSLAFALQLSGLVGLHEWQWQGWGWRGCLDPEPDRLHHRGVGETVEFLHQQSLYALGRSSFRQICTSWSSAHARLASEQLIGCCKGQSVNNP
jgi:hypothetical protein